ncbi:MAG: DNA-binding protein [Euryarchaeota archaeon]|nr:DNA-binding protein [Euryarchaeota archaeon]
MKIILDTNALMVPVQFGVDIFSELSSLNFDEYLVPSGVVRELKGIVSSGHGLDQNAARVALSIVSRFRIIETVGAVDDAILRLAIEIGAAVFTNDSELLRRLRDCGVNVVYMRQRSYLESIP